MAYKSRAEFDAETRRLKAQAKAAKAAEKKKRIKKSDLKVIRECLDAGIALEFQGAKGIRRFTAGQITDRIDRNAVQTTHLNSDLTGYVWLFPAAIETLAAKAREALARKDEILAQQAAAHAAAMGRD